MNTYTKLLGLARRRRINGGERNVVLAIGRIVSWQGYEGEGPRTRSLRGVIGPGRAGRAASARCPSNPGRNPESRVRVDSSLTVGAKKLRRGPPVTLAALLAIPVCGFPAYVETRARVMVTNSPPPVQQRHHTSWEALPSET